ncbi:MAG TPA: hypothetical protein VHM02_03955 [Thermoanaerobaculia bacterium]|nr:hypothetical protein [Thermoanaerobaculia bacterium]
MAVLALATATAASAQEIPAHLVVDGDVTAVLRTSDGEQRVSGRLAGHLTFDPKAPEEGARVELLSVALFGVEQQAVTGRETRGKPTGVVGFAAATGERPQILRFDPRSGTLSGSVAGRLDLPQLYEMTELRLDPEDDLVELPTIEAKLELRIALGNLRELTTVVAEPLEARIDLSAELSAGSEQLRVPPIRAQVSGRHLVAQIVAWPRFEIVRRLCIQPVRILTFDFSPPFFFFHLSGDGLAFGQPQAAKEWDKADIRFVYRDWITLFAAQFSTFSSDEAADLLSRVDVDDCIEVFFVDRFSPQTLFGGGATFGLGLASSKVISSDENADFGVDLTHLAHEFGHVLSLPHPSGAPGVSTNTLMCPSGFNNDNPKRNSQENKLNASNPLLTLGIKLATNGPNCQVSADCGPCP